MDILKDNPMSRFASGFFYPFQSLRFVYRNPKLLKYVLIPFLINLVVFSGAVFLGLDFFGDIVARYVPSGEAWYWAFLTFFAWLIASIVTALLVFFSFTVVGNLLASPFNDLLSERTEEIVTGVGTAEPFSWRTFGGDAWRAIIVEGKKMSFFVIGMLALLLLNLIPVLGQLLYSVAAILFTLFFLTVEYLGYVLSRKRLSFAQQRRYVFGQISLHLGFAVGVLCLLAIPLMQLLCIPLAVVGATRLYCEKGNLSTDR
ncbi:sulfate transporter CysZ [Desulfuromonas sp. AOP6]|uniref:sulfate transporter CysZ n=1 Tax=Desulfuromonas sp. AOP6 TaxID=1566351 RepID=UPI001CEC2267|nr:sulfate transporter CysZ [Desulfuromonas sp. AOP6]